MGLPEEEAIRFRRQAERGVSDQAHHVVSIRVRKSVPLARETGSLAQGTGSLQTLGAIPRERKDGKSMPRLFLRSVCSSVQDGSGKKIQRGAYNF